MNLLALNINKTYSRDSTCTPIIMIDDDEQAYQLFYLT